MADQLFAVPEVPEGLREGAHRGILIPSLALAIRAFLSILAYGGSEWRQPDGHPPPKAALNSWLLHITVISL
jgi:hypothetical protein